MTEFRLDPTTLTLSAGLAIEFAVTRSVRDAAVLLDAVAGPDTGAPGHPVPPHHPYRQDLTTPPGKLRIAWTTTPASKERIDPEGEKAVHETVKLLGKLGHTMIEAAPSYDWDQFLENAHVIWAAFNPLSVEVSARSSKRKPSRDTLEAVTLACYEDGRRRSALDLLYAQAYNNELSGKVGAFFETVDAFRHADDRASAGARRAESKCRNDGDGVDAAGVRVLSIQAAFQHDRTAGDLAAAALGRVRAADWSSDCGAIRR